jgi:hypothetical protein
VNASSLFLPASTPVYSPFNLSVVETKSKPKQVHWMERWSRAIHQVRVTQLTLKHSYEVNETYK